MIKQYDAEQGIIKVYVRIISVSILLIVLGVLSYRHFNTLPNFVSQSLAIEHKRLLNILAMVRSQWLSKGRPNTLLLNWDTLASNMLDDNKGANALSGNNRNGTQSEIRLVGENGNRIRLSKQGWPLLESNDKTGCYRLWHQLLASRTDELTVTYNDKNQVCHYQSANFDSVSYQALSGRVIYFKGR
ncbi:hypothetical protein ACFOD0_15715 [Shewanella intestini]|uniref:MSHA biogenesis protein MshF n=1 Tax=Shewanella intestini TaxID=2017544 RepID=A0ABS5I5F6_9GAMM|nr:MULTISPECIES: hypothetical protein [Shewanella]MBR9729063.1 hypothetical protein [Shewanella intestini]MRG37139.1 hypothetical protein [Shewanella sp. XMDDZSB0408]